MPTADPAVQRARAMSMVVPRELSLLEAVAQEEKGQAVSTA